jgi:hypothetical protein
VTLASDAEAATTAAARAIASVRKVDLLVNEADGGSILG